MRLMVTGATSLIGSGVVAAALARGDDVALADETPFVDQQSVQAYGAPGVDFVCADADFRTEAVAETV